jgi:hypothetical protein
MYASNGRGSNNGKKGSKCRADATNLSNAKKALLWNRDVFIWIFWISGSVPLVYGSCFFLQWL